MHKRILGLAVLLSALPTLGYSQQPSSQELLLKLERKVNENARTATKPALELPAKPQQVDDSSGDADLAAMGIKVRTLDSMKEQEVSIPASAPVLENELPHSDLLLRELPIGSRFTFEKGIYFPANTNAKVFVDGAYKLKVYSGSYPADELFKVETGVHSACAIKSTKGHVKLKGREETTTPSYIDFREVTYVEDGKAGRYLFTMKFDEKHPSESTEGVNVEITCLVPKDMNKEIASLKMKYIYDGFPGLFKIDIPKYVEL